MLEIIKKIIPKPIFSFFQPFYHYALALLGAVINNFPGKKIIVIGITGTKGKTTTCEIVSKILEEAGFKTAIASTLHFKIGEEDKRNLFKMTMPGRFFLQKFLREAVEKGCSHAVVEMTSEGAKQFRHKFVYPDALIFLNLAPEHIESHGSYENYLKAKLDIAKELETPYQKKSFSSEKSSGRPRGLGLNRDFSPENFSSEPVIISNIDDKEGQKFLDLNIKNKIPYSLHDAVGIKTDENGSSFQIGKTVFYTKLPGIFNVSNMLASIAYAKFIGIKEETIKRALEKIDFVRGRMEKIRCGQDFDVVVDYAHTPDSLKAVYETYKNHETICILGNTGGGRDTWKRPEMGKIADQYCSEIILTNEDPYDENPEKIVNEIRAGIKNKPVEIIMDRRTAIRDAISRAETLRLASLAQGASNKNTIAVLITGKGTDPYIMEANGKKTPWDDATVAREELIKILDIRK